MTLFSILSCFEICFDLVEYFVLRLVTLHLIIIQYIQQNIKRKYFWQKFIYQIQNTELYTMNYEVWNYEMILILNSHSNILLFFNMNDNKIKII